MKWRAVEIESLDPFKAMALEEMILESVSNGGPPVVHFWDWTSKAVTIGNFQAAEDEVHLFRCRRAKVPVIRRVSGGGTMFHSPGQEIVFSICAPPGIISRDISRSYHQILEPVVDALKGIGLDPSIIENNIMLGDLKISGSAQRRMAKAILHHGTILFDVNQYEMFSLIKGKDAVKTSKGTCSNYKPVTSISEVSDISSDELYKILKEGILKGKDHFISNWSDEELKRTDDLVSSRYTDDEWNLKL